MKNKTITQTTTSMDNRLQILNSYFDKIYVITLKRAVERQEKVNNHLKGVDFEYFYGIDKQDLDLDDLQARFIYSPTKAKKMHRNGKGMILGHIACSLSHRELYKKILESGHEKVLIMEDDFVPNHTFLNSLQPMIDDIPNNWELIYWGYYFNENINWKMKVKQKIYLLFSILKLHKLSFKEVKNLYPKPFSTHFWKAGFHNTTHAYSVKKSSLTNLIEAQTPVAFNADSLISYLIMNEKIKGYITKPVVFEQEIFLAKGESHSYISE